MCSFYRGTIESILTSCITVWYGSCTSSNRKTLQRICLKPLLNVPCPSRQRQMLTELRLRPEQDLHSRRSVKVCELTFSYVQVLVDIL
ncbi:hypothetical protein F2P81_021859 [Scophthalmus maximus]|uniref:Uncharacterized protein n=1 Tax=Scophthalmus maximus TaxID=52904 RepID=A0A6A4RYI5_SCOMX|nr:hypothetical protein F2P81_021859 [Scophthalmus maximus]